MLEDTKVHLNSAAPHRYIMRVNGLLFFLTITVSSDSEQGTFTKYSA